MLDETGARFPSVSRKIRSFQEVAMTFAHHGDKLLLSPEEGADLLGVGRTQMFELIARNEIESFKIGRLRKVPRDAIDTYIERLRAQAQVGAGADG
jgi:excisionase family DNA binding protein